MQPHSSLAKAFPLLLLVACGSAPIAPKAGPLSDSGLLAILQREFARTEPEVLARFLREGTEAERERAAFALGRFWEPGSEAAGALSDARSDESPAVRAAAEFTIERLQLELRGNCIVYLPQVSDLAASPFAQQRQSEDLATSAAMRALRKTEELSSKPGFVEAILAVQNLPVIGEFSHRADEVLIRELEERATTPEERAGFERGADSEIAWRILFVLQRRNAARLRAVEAENGEVTLDALLETNEWSRRSFLLWADSSDALARIYAVRGLATLDGHNEVARALQHALADDDWRVVCEACTGLGNEVSESNLTALLEAAKHKNPHVRRVAIEALGAFGELRERISRTLDSTHTDPSSSVQAAAIVTAARLYGDHSAAQLALKQLKPDAVVRSGVAEATRFLSSDLAIPMIQELARDQSLRVAGTAIESLGWHQTSDSRQLLHELLRHEDNGLRLMALLALKKMLEPDDLRHLERAYYETSKDNIGNELCFNAVQAAATITNEEAARFVAQATRSEHPYTRRVAEECFEMLAEQFDVRLPERAQEKVTLPELPTELVHLAIAERNPWVRVDTNRGSMTFELFPRETPFHVYNFLELARRGHYNGLEFHRVVPDFVIQGGDERGDGNGNTTWRGGSLPAEFTPRKYVRGSLGMPRNEDPDSGGSQIFVTHRTTPHLDGRYTLFGQLREGFEVLDRIEVGDRILEVVRVDS